MLRQDPLRTKQDRISRSSSGSMLLICLAAVLGTVAVGYLVATDMPKWAVALAAVGFALPLIAQRMLLLKVLSFLAPIYWLPFVPPAIYEAFRDVLFLAFFVALAFAVITQKLKFERLPKDSGGKFITFFLLAMVPSVLFSPNSLQSSFIWLRALQAGLFYVGLLLVVDTEEQVRQLLRLFMLGQLVSVGILWLETAFAALGVTLPWDVPGFIRRFGRGEFGLSYRRTAFSNSTAHILPIILGLGLGRKDASKVKWVSIAVVAFGAILVSHGRAGLVAGIVVIGLMLWKWARRYAIILIVVALLVAFISPSLIEDHFVNVPEWTYAVEGWARYDRLSGKRIGAFISAIELMRRHPFFGVGLGFYRSALERFESLDTLGLDQHQTSGAHNLYLHVGSETGVIAALAVTAFMIWVLRKGWRAFQTFPEGTFVSTLFGVVVAQFVTSLFEVETFWTIMRAFPFWIALAGIVKFYSPVAPPSVKQPATSL